MMFSFSALGNVAPPASSITSTPVVNRPSSAQLVPTGSTAHTLIRPPRRPNGCYECSQRRIRCDKTSPHCQKCKKKGLECSGQGLRVRFTCGLASQRKSSQHQSSNSSVPPAPASLTLRWSTVSPGDAKKHNPRKRHYTGADFVVSRNGNMQDGKEQETPSFQLRALALEPRLESIEKFVLDRSYQVTGNLIDARIKRRVSSSPLPTHLSLANPETRQFLHYFSEEIAPVMVVLDCISNGYRDIILPLAIEDSIVQRAVSVVAAHHLAARITAIQKPAMEGQMVIVSKLRRDSLQNDCRRLFSISNLATILVLLVGDTVTGGNDFVYLLELLRCLLRSEQIWEGLTVPVRQFFSQQVKMFEFFGFPLSHEQKGIDVLRNKERNYLDFMDYPLSTSSQHFEPLCIIRAVTEIASDIYRRRAESKLADEDSFMLLQEIQEKTAKLHDDVDGTHALVWTYFVAAAESSLPEHRAYFTARLKKLFHRTRFRSITVGIEKLPKLWSIDRRLRWTEMLVTESPVLVM